MTTLPSFQTAGLMRKITCYDFLQTLIIRDDFVEYNGINEHLTIAFQSFRLISSYERRGICSMISFFLLCDLDLFHISHQTKIEEGKSLIN